MGPTTQAPDLDVTSDLGGVYLKRADVESGPQRCAIASVTREIFEARDGRPTQNKIVLTFVGEPARKMSLNKTNLRIMTQVFGKHTRAWIGRSVVVFVDPTVVNRGQVVGGLRLQIPQLAPVARPATNLASLEEQIRHLQTQLQAAKVPTADVDDVEFVFGANVSS